MRDGFRAHSTPSVKRGVLVSVGIAVAFIATSIFLDWLKQPAAQRLHLGGEYFHIGRALADGRGFSDPFGEHTGPTAWMPPVYPLLLAGLIELVGSKNRVATAVVVLMTASMIVQAITLHTLARRAARFLPPFVVVVLYFAWVLVFDYWFFLLTSDVWILSLLVCFLVLAVANYLESKRFRPWAWGLLGGVGVLTSPTFGFAWGCLVVSLMLREKAERRAWVTAVLVALAVSAPWVARNAVTFHKFIPTKSNLMFEAYQANVLDGDGIYDLTTMVRHPYNASTTRYEYSSLGETAFIAHYGQVFRRELLARPKGYLRRLGNRTLAVTLKYVPLVDRMESARQQALQGVIYALPLIGLFGTLWIKGPHRRLLAVLGTFWLCYLLPYAVVAFYIRYFLPLTPLLVFTLFLAGDQLAAWRASFARPKLEAAAGAPVDEPA